ILWDNIEHEDMLPHHNLAATLFSIGLRPFGISQDMHHDIVSGIRSMDPKRLSVGKEYTLLSSIDGESFRFRMTAFTSLAS
ncbi:hypothetical protein AVEN_78872-1, partial [Araneus ventricosus]